MKIFDEVESERFLKKEGLPIVEGRVIKKLNELEEIKYPCVIKIIGPYHKTDVEGVRIVRNREEAERAFRDLLEIRGGKGLLYQEFVDGKELIVGVKWTPEFEHVLLLGVGGVFAEAIEDTVVRICPIDLSEAGKMIEELDFYKVLKGVRGEREINFSLLKRILVKVCKIAEKYPKVKELDINPLIVNEDSGRIVDAKIIWKG